MQINSIVKISTAAIFIVFVVVVYIESTNFLPNQVLQIKNLPKTARIIESGDNASIGTQTFINEWVVSISKEDLPIILAGRKYDFCKKSIKSSNDNETGLRRHLPFTITSCIEAYSKDSPVRAMTKIHANGNNSMLLIAYYTD